MFKITLALFLFSLVAESKSAFENIPKEGFLIDGLNYVRNSPLSNYCNPESKYPKVIAAEFLPGIQVEDVRELSVLSESEIQSAMTVIKNDSEIPFEFNFEGCDYRAHELAKFLEDRNIHVGKIFVGAKSEKEFLSMPSGKGRRVPSLNFDCAAGKVCPKNHAAVITLVRDENNIISPRVLDPSLSEHPMTISKFKAMLDRGGSVELKVKVTHRFKFRPSSKAITESSNWRRGDSIEVMEGIENLKLANKAYDEKRCSEMANHFAHTFGAEETLRIAKGSCVFNAKQK